MMFVSMIILVLLKLQETFFFWSFWLGYKMNWFILYTYSKSYKHYDIKQFFLKKTWIGTKSNVIHIKKFGYVVFAHILKEVHHNLLQKQKMSFDRVWQSLLILFAMGYWKSKNYQKLRFYFYEELIGDFEAMGKVTQKISLGIHFLFSSNFNTINYWIVNWYFHKLMNSRSCLTRYYLVEFSFLDLGATKWQLWT
jgi:hypothetical protein